MNSSIHIYGRVHSLSSSSLHGSSGLNWWLIMRDRLVFVCKFLVFSIILFSLWIFLGRFYLIFLAYTCTPLLHLMGYMVELFIGDQIVFLYLGAQLGITHAELTNYNIIPFIALVLATPIPVRRMARNILIGIPFLFFSHMLDLIAHFPLYYESSIIASFLISVSAVLRLLLPFALWFLLCYEYVFKTFRTIQRVYCCPICGKQTHGIIQHIDDSHADLTQTERKTIERYYHNHPEIKRKKNNDTVNTNSIER